ncbi:DUF975 family protein [Lacticaseibacillus suihuaensis]
MTRSELKGLAKARLAGNWGWAVGLSLLGAIMASIIGGFTAGILEAWVMVGISFSFLRLMDDEDRGNGVFNNIFSGFTGSQPVAVFLNTLLAGIFMALWTLLLVVPGIVKAFSYSQVDYILSDMQRAGRQIGATDAITASRELMVGHKWEYFVLQLSFLGWALLSVVTLGIGFLWLTPYMQATNAAFYRNLAGDRFRTPEDDMTDAY